MSYCVHEVLLNGVVLCYENDIDGKLSELSDPVLSMDIDTFNKLIFRVTMEYK